MCREGLAGAGKRDLLLDQTLMHLVATGEMPEGVLPEDAHRCRQAARWLRYERGQLWVDERRVPAMWEREALIQRAATTMGLPHGSRLYPLLRARYYWAGMSRDCLAVCARSLGV